MSATLVQSLNVAAGFSTQGRFSSAKLVAAGLQPRTVRYDDSCTTFSPGIAGSLRSFVRKPRQPVLSEREIHQLKPAAPRQQQLVVVGELNLPPAEGHAQHLEQRQRRGHGKILPRLPARVNVVDDAAGTFAFPRLTLYDAP